MQLPGFSFKIWKKSQRRTSNCIQPVEVCESRILPAVLTFPFEQFPTFEGTGSMDGNWNRGSWTTSATQHYFQVDEYGYDWSYTPPEGNNISFASRLNGQFKIDPQVGEKIGDPVKVTVNVTFQASSGVNSDVVNEKVSFTTALQGKTFMNQAYANDFAPVYVTGSASVLAKIGDTIDATYLMQGSGHAPDYFPSFRYLGPEGEVSYSINVAKAPVSDISVTSLKWDSSKGGASFAYQVIGQAIPSDVSPVLNAYWASGPTAADRISSAIFSINADRTVGTHGSINIPPENLRNVPSSAKYLLVIADPDKVLEEISEDNNLKPLADVGITYGGIPPAPKVLSGYTISIIKEALRDAGQATAEVNSTYRTPEEQADEMLTIINAPNGLDEARSLYTGIFGKQVIDVYASARKAFDKRQAAYNRALKKYNKKHIGEPPVAPQTPDYRELMGAKIAEIVRANPDTAFAHCRDFTQWNTLDIRATSITNRVLFLQALNDLEVAGKIDHIISPPLDRAFHIEIRQ